MIKALLFDFARTLLFPVNKTYQGGLNSLYRKLVQTPNFDFLSNFELNEEAFIFLGNLKYKYKLYMFTSESIQDAPEIKDKVDSLFDKIFSAEQMMLDKKDTETYKKLADIMELDVQDILFVDDNPDNILAARDAGMTTLQYKDNKSLMNYITSLE